MPEMSGTNLYTKYFYFYHILFVPHKTEMGKNHMEVNKNYCGEKWMKKHRTKFRKHAHNLEKKKLQFKCLE